MNRIINGRAFVCCAYRLLEKMHRSFEKRIYITIPILRENIPNPFTFVIKKPFSLYN